MGAPNVYYWDDAGAPAFSNESDWGYEILKACLVTGVGSKPAAGWSLLYDNWAASGHAVFRNAGQSGVLGMLRTTVNSNIPYLYVAEAMADAVTPINGRSGQEIISGTDWVASATTSSKYQRLCASNKRRWVCIANANFAILFFADADAYMFGTAPGQHQYYQSIVMFGAVNDSRGLGTVSAPLLGNFQVFGGAYNDTVGYSTHHYSNVLGAYGVGGGQRQGTLLYGHNGVPVAAGHGLFCPVFCNTQSSSYVPWRNVLGFTSVDFVRCHLVAAGASCVVVGTSLEYAQEVGLIPGVLFNPLLASAGVVPIFTRLNKGFFRDVVAVGGRNCLLCVTNGGHFLISLDAADWE